MAYPGRVLPVLPFDQAIAWDDLHPTFMGPESSSTRQRMWQGFQDFCGALRAVGITADIFIGGSFLTDAHEPDCLVFSVAVHGSRGRLDDEQIQVLGNMERERDTWLTRWSCDFDFFFDEDPDATQAEMIDRWLNMTCANPAGPPVRAVMVKLAP